MSKSYVAIQVIELLLCAEYSISKIDHITRQRLLTPTHILVLNLMN